MMNKKRTRAELAFPVATIPQMGGPAAVKPKSNPAVIKSLIRGAVQGAYHLKTPLEPSKWDAAYGKRQKPLATPEQIDLVTHLIESLQPADAIEVSLACQYAITFIRGMDKAIDYHGGDTAIELFRFSHEALECLTRYRTKGAQLISVCYNHSQSQINNHINITEKDDKTIEV
jgi:hypothetical protein